ncbi:unnamed protein product [Mytilus coruscus]|uniref:Uncharacterized protein n=1 Tax=Mytilus coruscus TaxID=42192 RepID=A0A6J8DDY4_MYTCO|nr:unnamed protein product [Mytilus coruscus]
MVKINRGRLTISANIVLTASLMTRTFTFGFIMMSILMKVNNDILNEDVIKIIDMEILAGMPLGTTVKYVVFSFIGVFVLELVSGIFGIWGAIGRKKRILAVNVLMSSIMIIVYLINIVNLSIIYNKKTDLNDTLSNYTSAYQATILYNKHYISYTYWEKTFPNFLKKLGCQNSYPEIYHCGSVYVQKLDTYLEIYIGIIVTCIVCQIVTIVAAEYTFRKLEFKEKKPNISENKYYLLLSLKHGIFRSLIIFIKENWNRSKVVVASVLLKVASLTAGVGLLGLGLTLLGDEFINNSSLKHIFYKLQFHNYYFYDILVGLAAASVVLGTATSTVAVLGLVGSWKKSPIVLVTINGGMKFQLWLQQLGYFNAGVGNEITTKWNDMIMTLQILDSAEYNAYSSFDYFGGCGGYKTETCADVILFKTKMFVGWFLSIVLLQIVLEIIGFVFVSKEYLVIMLTKSAENPTGATLNAKSVIFRKMFKEIKSFCVSNWKRSKISLVHFFSLGCLFVSSELEVELMKQFNSTNGGYDYSDKSATRDWSSSLSWNTLFVQAECCGVGPRIESSFTSTYWYLYGDRSAGQRIPVQCCISQTDVFPYSTRKDSNCTTSMLDGYYRSQVNYLNLLL